MALINTAQGGRSAGAGPVCELSGVKPSQYNVAVGEPAPLLAAARLKSYHKRVTLVICPCRLILGGDVVY